MRLVHFSPHSRREVFHSPHDIGMPVRLCYPVARLTRSHAREVCLYAAHRLDGRVTRRVHRRAHKIEPSEARRENSCVVSADEARVRSARARSRVTLLVQRRTLTARKHRGCTTTLTFECASMHAMNIYSSFATLYLNRGKLTYT